MRIARLLGPLAALLVVVFSQPGTAAIQLRFYDSFFAFGDSLADIGNVRLTSRLLGIDPAPPPSTRPHLTYFHGRFSNGPIAFEYLWKLLSGHAPGSARGLQPSVTVPTLGPKAAVDFAYGGTGTPYVDLTPGGLLAPGLKGQVELFRLALRGRTPSPLALYAIVTGANDYRDDQYNQMMDPPDVVNNIVDAVERLYELGARHVMVVNMPDLGRLPGGGGEESPESELSAIHNMLLANALALLAAQRPELRVIPVDINEVFKLLPAGMDVTTPALDAMFPPEYLPPGFRMSQCLFINPVTCQDVPTFDTNWRYLFWDVVHPTTDAHRLLGQYMYDVLQE